MFDSLGKALSAVFGTPRPTAKTAGKKTTAGAAASPRDQAMARIREAQGQVVTPERAELIRHAMEVRRSKQKILMDLNDADRQKLAVMALRAFLNEGKDQEKT
jgi:hypothetical protein